MADSFSASVELSKAGWQTVHSFRAIGITAYLKNGCTLEGCGDGKSCVDAHDTAL